jgi:hypothetical protein
VGSILFGFDADKFDTVSRAFTDKYGPATKSATQTLQNRIGATFTDTKLTWEVEGGTIVLRRYSGSFDRSMLVISDNEFDAAHSRAIKADRERAVKDLD